MGKAPTFGYSDVRPIKEQRESLPVFKLRDQLIQAVNEHQVSCARLFWKVHFDDLQCTRRGLLWVHAVPQYVHVPKDGPSWWWNSFYVSQALLPSTDVCAV